MADQIINCVTYKDGATVKYHVVTFELATGEKFTIYIDSSEMADPTDTVELKTLAKTKAEDVKVSITATPFTQTTDASLNGDVTLE